MAALTGNRLVTTKQMDSVQGGIVVDMPAYGTADVLYKGAILEILATGYVQPANIGSSLQVAGICLEEVTTTAVAGAVTAKVLVGAMVEHAITATVSSVGALVYATDDQTLSLVETLTTRVGWFVAMTTTANVAIIKFKYPGQPFDAVIVPLA